MMQTSLTILMPVKNAMPYLRQTLASIEVQTLREFRLIAWDNGSTDGSVDELKRWIPSRIAGRIITDRPLPLGACRAELVRMATTDLCAVCDADDVYQPQRLATQLSFMAHHPQVGIVGSQIELIDGQGHHLDGAWALPCEDAEIRWRLPFANALMQPTVMFRRSVVLAAGNYRPIQPGQDYDLWLRLWPHTQMANLSQRLVQYRMRSDSISHDSAPRGVDTVTELFAAYADQFAPALDRRALVRLHSRLVGDPMARVSLGDLHTLHRFAAVAARTVGQKPSYFSRTERYAQQQQNLRARWLKQLPFARYADGLRRSINPTLTRRAA
jgi:hypothetical protein